MEAKHLIAPAIAVLLAVGGILILTEVVRPFRDLRSDGPLAVVLLAAGLVLAILGLAMGWGRAWPHLIALAVNALPLLAVAVLFIILSGFRGFR